MKKIKGLVKGLLTDRGEESWTFGRKGYASLNSALFLMTLIIAVLYILLDQTVVIIEIPKLEIPKLEIPKLEAPPNFLSPRLLRK